MAALYQILNKVTGERYVGVTSTSLKRRWHSHLYNLRHGLATEKLQNAFILHGESSFAISEIANGLLEDMLLMEAELTKETSIHGYNTIIGGGGKEERRRAYMVHIEKMSSDPQYRGDVCRKISESNIGKPVSEETKAIWRKQRGGVKWREFRKENRSKQYSGSGNPNYGKHRIYLNIDTGVYYTTPELLNYLGIAKCTLDKYIRDGNKKVSSFIKT